MLQIEIRSSFNAQGHLISTTSGYVASDGVFVLHGPSARIQPVSNKKSAETSYDHGVLDGPFLRWYDSGRKSAYGMMIQGQPMGALVLLSDTETGYPRMEEMYSFEDQQVVLHEVIYYPDEHTSLSIRYQDNKPFEGELVQMNRRGDGLERVHYQGGAIQRREPLTDDVPELFRDHFAVPYKRLSFLGVRLTWKYREHLRGTFIEPV